MEKLRDFLNGLPTESAKVEFARQCGTTLSYLRKTISARQRLGPWLALRIERQSEGAVMGRDLRPDLDWGLIESVDKT